MIFSLEVLKAKHGDCLVLHYGDANDPKIIVVDGGPGRVYEDHLKPRLLEIKNELAPNASLPLAMVMVSHMDDDHVNGILDLTSDIISATEDQIEPDFAIENMWFNSFDDIIGNIAIPIISDIGASAQSVDVTTLSSQFGGLDHHHSAVIASTGQGRRLRRDADFLDAIVNAPFSSPAQGNQSLVRFDPQNPIIDWGNHLQLHVVHPNQERLEEMQEKWDRDLRTALQNGDDSIIFASLGDRDKSPFNLASIVCLANCNGNTILMTGDARDDDILGGLETAGLMNDQGNLHVDILKIPHHGSDKNVSRSFFERVTADHYVISGNGRHHNPDKATLIMLEEGTGNVNHDDFTIHMTNRTGKFNLEDKIDQFIQGKNANNRNFEVNFIEDSVHSIIIDLLDEVTY
ncbi:MAG: hypothetical protein AAGB24_06720 [Bacteroidota bacterium]